MESANGVVNDLKEVVKMTSNDETFRDVGIEEQEVKKQSVKNSVTDDVATPFETDFPDTEIDAFDVTNPITK